MQIDYNDPWAVQQAQAQQSLQQAQQAKQYRAPQAPGMVGRVYVGAHPLQGLAEVLRNYQAGNQEEAAMQQLQNIGQQRQEATNRDMGAFVQALRGTPAFEAAGPAPQGAPQEGGYQVPAQKGDPYAAYSLAAGSQSPMVRQMGVQGLAQLPQLEAAKEEKMANRAWQEQQKQLDRQAREDNIRLMASMRPERQAQIIQTDQGPMQLVNGQAVPIIGAGGQPVKGPAGDKALNEGQANATMYGMRMSEADKILRNLEKGGNTNTGLISTGLSGAAGSIPLVGEALGKGVENTFNVLPSALGGLSEPQQQTKQARANFITAVLRKESGASISPAEFSKEEAKYFPQAGDSDKVIQQKQAARQLAIEAMKIGAGPGASKIGGATSSGPTSSGW